MIYALATGIYILSVRRFSYKSMPSTTASKAIPNKFFFLKMNTALYCLTLVAIVLHYYV